MRSLLLWAVSFANLLNLFFLSNWLPLGIGRAGSIVGPTAAAQLIAYHFTNEILFMIAAIPAAISSLLIAGTAKTQPRRERPLVQL
jgi:hypothetical protein